MFVIFPNEKDLRSHESILLKIAKFSKVIFKAKQIGDTYMKNIVYALETQKQITFLSFEDTYITKNASRILVEYFKKSQVTSVGFQNT